MPKRLVSPVEPTRIFGTSSKGWEAIGRAVLEGAGQGCLTTRWFRSANLVSTVQSGFPRQ